MTLSNNMSTRTHEYAFKAARITLALALMLAVMSSSCSKVPTGPNVVLITIDALRADHLSCYGYERKTSPFIDSIAKKGALFNNAYATSSWTAPSMASIFTSLYPRNHGVRHGFISKKAIISQEMLSSGLPNLARTLKKAGYTTFGISSNGHMSPETGFDQGFDYFTTLWFPNAPPMNRTALGWKPLIEESKKYFFWIHYFDPHSPYLARKPWIDDYNSSTEAVAKWSGRQLKDLRSNRNVIRGDAEAKQTLLDLYDSEINYTDDYLKQLFEALDLDKDSLVIITADHGEEFLDHGLLGHGQTLYEEVIRVPLIIRLPNDNTGRKKIDHPISNRDIFSTILDVAGIPAPPEVSGKSFLPFLSESAQRVEAPLYFELSRNIYRKAVRLGNWKLISGSRRGRQRSYYLYNLESDPGETKNVLAAHSRVAQNLENLINQWVASEPEFKAPKISETMDDKKKEKLRSLGYVK